MSEFKDVPGGNPEMMEDSSNSGQPFDANIQGRLDQYSQPSDTSTALRAGVLKTGRFMEYRDIVETPTFDGYLYEEITDADGVMWKVPRENGYATSELGDERLTTFGANMCFVGIIHTEVGEKSYRTVLHSNPFSTIPVDSEFAESPFIIFSNHLPEDAQVKGIQLVYRPSTEKPSVLAVENYCLSRFSGISMTRTVIPFDERFDLQTAKGEVTVFKAGKPEGIKVDRNRDVLQ